MKSTDHPKMKPCPFCGGPASLYSVVQPNNDVTYAVDCENDGCEISSCTLLHKTPAEAVEAWNRRCKHGD